MYAITGATGKLGRLVLAGLSKMTDPSNTVAAVRDPTRAEDLAAEGIVVRQADFDCSASLRSAFQGVDRLLLISSNAVGRRVAQHANVIAAAKAAGVTTIFYTSMRHADTSPIALAEEHLKRRRLSQRRK
jgi:NAD(P)H dehydrogenase (quinone)